MSNKNYLSPAFLSIALAIGYFVGSYFSNPFSNKNTNTSKRKILKLIDHIDQNYVDQINTDSVVDMAAKEIMKQLDPHSVYIDKKAKLTIEDKIRGNFVGIGINFYMKNDTLAVITPIKDGPCHKSGIQSGDRILRANQITLYGKNFPNDSLFKHLKGPINTKVELQVFRKETDSLFNKTIIREQIPLPSIDASFKIKPYIGYIRINRFSEKTHTEFKKAIKELFKNNTSSDTLILDLRNNSGGIMSDAVEIADEFLQKDNLIVKTVNRKNSSHQNIATSGGLFENGQLYVLIDEKSASASEIIAGAIQDNDRGTIVGRRSFGKGLVQQEKNLGDGSAIRLTVARYYTPSGRSIQKPYSSSKRTYFNEFEKRFYNGELYKKDSIKVADSLKYYTKKGRIVYGGGGIVPDLFIPIEGDYKDHEILMVIKSRGLTSNFVFDVLDKYGRESFIKSSNEQLYDQVVVLENYYASYCEYINAIFNIEHDFDPFREMINQTIYGEILSQIHSEDAFYFKAQIKIDPMIGTILKNNPINQAPISH